MKKQRLIQFFLMTSVFLSVFTFFCYAESFEQNDFVYEIISDSAVEIVDYNGDEAKIVVPAKLGGKAVTRISKKAFSGLKNIKTITIPASVKTIERNAITGCPKLTTLTVKNGNLKKFDGAVSNCVSLQKIILPKNIDYFTPVFGCPKLQSVDINSDNDNYTSYDGVVYSKNKKSVIFYPSGKSEVYYIIPDCVKYVGDSCFASAKQLEAIFVPTSVTSLGSGCFSNTTLLICYGGSKKPDCLDNIPWRVIVNSEPLGIPYGISETHNKNSVTLKWSKVLGASGYRVYIFDEEDGKFKTYQNVSSNSCKIDGLQSGKNYTFAIKAFTKTVDGVLWAGAYAKFSAKTNLDSPKLSLSNSEKGVTAKWKDIPNNDGFVLYYSTDKNGDYKKAVSTKKLSYLQDNLDAGETYYFKVRAFQKEGDRIIYGPYSSVESITVGR